MKKAENFVLFNGKSSILFAPDNQAQRDNVPEIVFSPIFALFLISLIFGAGLSIILKSPNPTIFSIFIFGITFSITRIRKRNQKAGNTGNGSLIPIEDDLRFRTLIKHAPEAIVVLDPNKKMFVDANKHAEKLFGYPLEELCKLGPLDLSPHAQPSGLTSSYLASERIREAINGKSPIFEWTHINNFGEQIPCEVQLVTIPSDGEKLIRASILDLRDKKKYEADNNHRDQKASRRIDELAGLAIASASISSSLDLDKVLEIVAQQLANLLGVQICFISYMEDIQNEGGPSLKYINKSEGPLPRSHKVNSVLSKMNLTDVSNRLSAIQFHLNGNSNGKHEEALHFSRATSVLLLPIIVKNKSIGVIELQDTRKREIFDERDLYLAQTLGQQAANAIENARLFQSTNQRLIELQNLKDVAIASTESTKEDDLIFQASQLIPNNLFADNFGVLLADQDQDTLILHQSYWSKSKLSRRKISFGEGIIGEAAQKGEAIRIGIPRADAKFLEEKSICRSALCVPIKIGRDVIGVINAESEQIEHFTEHDERLFVTFANQLAGGIGRLRNEEAQKRKGNQLKILNQLSGLLAGVLEEEKLFQIVVKNLKEQLNYLGVYLFSINEEEGYAQLEDHQGTTPPTKNGNPFRQSVSQGLLGKALRENRIIISNRVLEDSDFYKVPGIENVRAEMVIPIKFYKKNKYLLALDSKLINAFGEDEIAAYQTLADHISVSLESINLFKATRRQLQELTVLHAISNSVVNAKSEMELLERATEVIGATLYSDIFGFLLLDEGKAHLRVHPSYRGIDKKSKVRLVGLNEGISGKVASTGKAIRIADVRNNPDYLVINPEIRSELTVPLTGSKGVLGVINAESVEVNAFTDSDLRLLSTIAGQLGTAIEKLRLFEAEKLQRVQAETLQEVAAILGGASDISKVADLILEELNRVVPFESASIQIIDENDLVISAVAGELSKNVLGYRLPIKEDKVSHPILNEHRTIFSGDIKNHPDWLLAPGTEKVESWIGAPLVSRGECIGVLTVDGYKKNQFTKEDSQLVSSFAIHAAIAIENSRLFKEIEDSYSQTVSALANAIDVRDSYTNGHSQRLAKLAKETGRILNCSGKTLDDIYWAALLHDIGKIGVPDEILRKPAKLTAEEFSIIKQHPEIGERIIEPIKKLAHLAPVIRSHQEKFNGSGYPDGLKGNEIPLAARIISVADAYVAMTDDRVYQKAMSVQEAIVEINECAGSQFDPEVVVSFLQAIRNIKMDDVSAFNL